MILSKNPQGKKEANHIKNMMLSHKYTEETMTRLVGIEYEYPKWIRKETTANLLVYKTDNGEYKHPIDMNAEMAKRFANIERFSNILEQGSKASDTRALRLQELYTMYKSMDKKQVAYHVRYLRNNGYDSQPDRADEIYVIENLLNIK